MHYHNIWEKVIITLYTCIIACTLHHHMLENHGPSIEQFPIACTLLYRDPVSPEESAAENSFQSSPNSNDSLLPFAGFTWKETAYIILLLMVQVYCLFIHGTGGLLVHLEFLPLLLTSVTCAIGILWSWVLCYCELFEQAKWLYLFKLCIVIPSCILSFDSCIQHPSLAKGMLMQ